MSTRRQPTSLFRPQGSKQAWGFTLIELTLVLSIVAMLSVYGLPKLLSSAPFTLSAQGDVMAADLRRVQWMATTDNISLCVHTTATQYSAHPYTSSCNLGVSVTDPTTGSPFVVTLPSRTSLTDTVSATPLYFNSLGQPSRSGAFQLASTDAPTTVVVQVTPVTGFVATSISP